MPKCHTGKALLMAARSGLQLYAKQLTEKEWNEWLQLFKDKATAAVGYPVGEPEDGYRFKYW